MNTNVVIIDDVRSDVATLEEALDSEPEFSVTYTAWSDPDEIERVLESIKREQCSVILLDVFFDGQEKGDKIYKLLKEANKNAQVIVLSVREDIETQKKYINLGAYDYVIKDSSPGVIRNVIAGIKLAGDKGVQYLAEFEAIDQLYNNQPEHALSQFEALFNRGFKNFNCSKQYAARLKAYFGRSFDRIEFSITTLFEMMLANCQRIESGDPSDYENLMDMAALYLHRGEEGKAVQVFRKLLFASEAPPSVTNRVFSWMETVYYGQTLNLPNVAWLRTKLIDQKNQDEQRILITALRDFKTTLWREALSGWFSELKALWEQDNKEQAAGLIVWLVSEYGPANIREVLATLEPTFRGDVLQLCEAAARFVSAAGTGDAAGLIALLEMLFDARNVAGASETEKRRYLQVLEQAFFLTLDSDDLSEENATRIYKLMSRLPFSTAEMIQSVRSNIKGELPDLWKKYLLNVIKHLSTTGEANELHTVINANKDDLLNGLDPEALAEMGVVLDESKSPLAAEFYQEAVDKYLRKTDGAKSADDLFEPKRLILLLEDRKRTQEVKVLKERLKQRIARLSKSIRLLDEERIAVIGVRNDNKERYLTLLQERMGGAYTWYDGRSRNGAMKLIESLKRSQYTYVIYINAGLPHGEAFTPVHEAIVKLNENFATGIKEILIPNSSSGPESVVNEVQKHFADYT